MDFIQRGTKQYTRTNFALFAAGLVTFANLYLTQPLLPILSSEYGISPATASLSLSVATLTLAISLLVFGTLSEAIGRKNIMSASMIAASILTILFLFVPNFETLLLLRFLQGFIFAGVPAIAMAYLGEEMEPSQLAFTMGIYISGNSIGGLFGRILIGSLSDVMSWQLAAAILGVVSLLISLYFIWALPPSKHFTKQPFHFKSLSKTLLLHLTNRKLAMMFIIAFTLMGSFVTLFNYISFKLLGAPYSLSTTIVGSIFIVYLVGTFSSTWFGSLASKWGQASMLFIGISFMMIGVMMTLFLSLWIKIIGIIIFTFGFFGAHSIASGIVSGQAIKDKAQASSLYLFAYYLGSSICGSIGGIYWEHYNWNGIVGFIIILLVIATSSALFYIRAFVKPTVS